MSQEPASSVEVEGPVTTPDVAKETRADPGRAGYARAAWIRARHQVARLVIFQIFARDHVLAWATLALGLGALLPLFATPFLPLADLPANVAQGALLPEILFKDGLAAYHYRIQWLPVPYWTTHVLIAVLAPIIGVLWAAKVMVALVVLALPLSVMRVLYALGKDPRLGVVAFLIAWDHNLYAGWTAYLLGMNAALWAVAWLLEANTPRAAVRVALLSCFLGITHIQAVAYFGLTATLLLLTRRPFLRMAAVHLVALSGLAVSVVPWLIQRFSASAGSVAFNFEFHTVQQRLNSLFKFTLDNQPVESDVLLAGAAFLMLLFGPLVLASLGQRDVVAADRPSAPAGAAAILFAVPLLLYLTMPMTISGPMSHWYTYPRYATFTLVSLLFLPRVSLDGWRASSLLPAAVLSVVYHSRIAVQFADYGERARPFLQIMEQVAPNSAYLPLELDDSDTATRLATFNQIHSYIAGAKGGYDPHLFDNNSIPFLYRQERRLPQTAWNGAASFNLRDHGRHYDYIVIQGLRYDPIPRLKPVPGVRAKLLVEAGRFRLYKIEKD